MVEFRINQNRIGSGHPVYVVAELSANHGQNYDQAVRMVQAAKVAQANAVKVQTYTPDTLTLRCDAECFRIRGGTLWDGRTLYDLYAEAYMPWEWQPKLKAVADEMGLDFFSTPFDATAVEFLERIPVPAYKIASFELVDLPLIARVAATGKPMILSTGMATLAEIREAVETAQSHGAGPLALLKCTSAYPASPEEMNLRTMRHLAESFQVPVGLSDHTLGTTVPVASVCLGGCLVEKHFTLSRQAGGPDAAFSLEPDEFRAMVDAIRIAEKALGRVQYDLSPKESQSRVFRRSLFVVEDIKRGETFTEKNIRSIRPALGLHPRHLPQVLGKHAKTDMARGTPLAWEHVEGGARRVPTPL